MNAPCLWPVSYLSCADCSPATGVPAPLNGLSDADRAKFERMAVELLWAWTKRVFGVCTVVSRPCLGYETTRPSTFAGRGPIVAVTAASPMGCGCSGACYCSGDASYLTLVGPVVSVDSILIDGVEVAPEAYQLLLPSGVLYRVDGTPWPTNQRLGIPSTEVGTFEITYQRGVPVPTGGQMAAGMLAQELAKAACQDNTCQLPQRLQTLTRQGVTVGFADSFDDLEKGRVGIWAIDSWVASVNTPRRLSSVYSPDIPARLSAWRQI